MTPSEVVRSGPYGLFYLLAIVTAAAVMRDAGRRRGWNETAWAAAILAWVAGGVIGALIPHMLLGDLAAPRTSLGALAGSTLALVAVARAIGIRLASALDSTALALPLGAAVVRIGCFLAECCQGMVTSLPVGIARHADDLARHPVQLYEAGLESALALVLVRRARAQHAEGSPILFSIGWLAVIRFVTEFVRDNDKFGSLSLAQWIMIPLAAACFVALSRKSLPSPVHTPAGSSKIAVAMGLAAIALVAMMSGALPPLERGVLVVAILAFTVAVRHHIRAANPTGIALLALQIPAITTDSTFPRVYTSIGGGMSAGAYDFVHQYSTGDCEGPSTREEWKRHHTFVGATGELGTRRQSSATRGVGFRVRAYADANHAGAAVVTDGTPSSPGARTRRSIATSAVGDVDWKYLGLSLGATVGRFNVMDEAIAGYHADDAPPMTGFGAFGLRLGSLTSVSVELRVGDETPYWIPGPLSTVALGLGDKHGNRIRVGTSESGVFVGGRHMSRTGLEVLPSMTMKAGSGYDLTNALQGGVMVRKWFRPKGTQPIAAER
jgi:phosphatidylglycerol---prolipoprotein diacylglyceryl transferase